MPVIEPVAKLPAVILTPAEYSAIKCHTACVFQPCADHAKRMAADNLRRLQFVTQATGPELTKRARSPAPPGCVRGNSAREPST